MKIPYLYATVRYRQDVIEGSSRQLCPEGGRAALDQLSCLIGHGWPGSKCRAQRQR